MSRRFKGTAIPLGGPERVLPTESCGIDLREARSMNRPPGREGGYGGFEDRPRRFERDSDDGPRRTFSRRTEEEGGAPGRDEGDDWRAGPARSGSGIRRFESASERPERRESRRSVDDEKETAADAEDDWRAGAASKPSAFAERPSFADRRGDQAPRRFDNDSGEAPVRRFSSRAAVEVDSRADDQDWRRPSREASIAEDDQPQRIERTRSARPVAATVADETDNWRTVKPAAPSGHSATPWARKSVAAETSTPSKPVSRDSRREYVSESPPVRKASPKKAAVVEEDKWSSDEEEEVVVEEKPDMEKINKCVAKIQQYVEASASEDMTKKIEAMVKKIPVNFGKPDLSSVESVKSMIASLLQSNKFDSEVEVDRLVGVIAPIVVCLEAHFVEFGGKVEEFQANILESVQVYVASVGSPRLSPETALVEQIWLSMYEKQLVCEEAFNTWLESEAFASPMKSTTLFQTEAFRAWLYEFELPGVEASAKKAPVVDTGKDEWSSSDDDSDIEALVPKRAAAGMHVRPAAVAPLRR